ncbi:MAG: anti-sigma factor, partial [Rhizobacter sp.]
LGLWQGVSGLALAASLFMGVLLLRQTAPEPAGARYVALLQSPDGRSTGWMVELQDGGALRLVAVGDVGSVPAGRAWQFWTKPEGAAGPTSLGLVKAGQTVELPAARLPAVGPRQLFEITLEPEAGSPIGRPTGPILFVGKTVPI